MDKQQNIIFLYAEITPYLLGCLNSFSLQNSLCSITVIYQRKFEKLNESKDSNYVLVSKKQFKSKEILLKYCKSICPKLLIVSGRMSKDYLYVALKLRNKTLRVTVQDTIYKRSTKQFIQKLLSNYLYRRYFDKFWGIGSPQTKFALDIGYKENEIKEGFYVADKIFFEKSKVFQYDDKDLNILYIGRLVKEKNIIRLAKAVNNINLEKGSNHKVCVIGGGYLRDKIETYKCIDYKGLMNQDEIIKVAHNCHVFCLPSIYEPWGVVVHEMAALGLPILSSFKCGSSYDLVKENYNGFKFNPYDIEEISNVLRKFIALSNIEKEKFSRNSIKIAQNINYKNWNNTLLSFLT